MTDKENELQYIKEYINETNTDFYYNPVTWKQIKSLWTAYCLHHDIMPDTYEYDYQIKTIHTQILKKSKNNKKNPDKLRYKKFKKFDLYMGSYLS